MAFVRRFAAVGSLAALSYGTPLQVLAVAVFRKDWVPVDVWVRGKVDVTVEFWEAQDKLVNGVLAVRVKVDVAS